jgi:uncharacterized membrane protein
MMGFGTLFTVLILAALAYALAWLPQNVRLARLNAGESASDILKTRFAQGEIARAEYDEIRRDIGE